MNITFTAAALALTTALTPIAAQADNCGRNWKVQLFNKLVQGCGDDTNQPEANIPTYEEDAKPLDPSPEIKNKVVPPTDRGQGVCVSGPDHLKCYDSPFAPITGDDPRFN